MPPGTLLRSFYKALPAQVGLAELKVTADYRTNIGGIIIGGPIIGQWSAQYLLTDHQDAERRPMIVLILSR